MTIMTKKKTNPRRRANRTPVSHYPKGWNKKHPSMEFPPHLRHCSDDSPSPEHEWRDLDGLVADFKGHPAPPGVSEIPNLILHQHDGFGRFFSKRPIRMIRHGGGETLHIFSERPTR